MAQTIQELLKDGPSGGQTMKYLNTVQAYDRWAEVRNISRCSLLSTFDSSVILHNILIHTYT